MGLAIFKNHLSKNHFHGILQIIMETSLTYSFNFSLQSFSLNLLQEQEADKVKPLLLSYNNFSDKFYFGISLVESDCLEGILQISEKDYLHR